jgi:hypothetical protein
MRWRYGHEPPFPADWCVADRIPIRRELRRLNNRTWQCYAPGVGLGLWLGICVASSLSRSGVIFTLGLIGGFSFFWLGHTLASPAWQQNVEKIWAKHGLCTKCGYDLRGNHSGQCPECGEVRGGD